MVETVQIVWDDPNHRADHGIKGQRWGVRRYQNADGSLTLEGAKRYGYTDAMFARDPQVKKERFKAAKVSKKLDALGQDVDDLDIKLQKASDTHALAWFDRSDKYYDEYLSKHPNGMDLDEYINRMYFADPMLNKAWQDELKTERDYKIAKAKLDKAVEEAIKDGLTVRESTVEGNLVALRPEDEEDFGIKEYMRWLELEESAFSISDDYRADHGIKGQRWGERRYQNTDGSLTDAGRARYGVNKAFVASNGQVVTAPKNGYVKVMRKLATSKMVANSSSSIDRKLTPGTRAKIAEERKALREYDENSRAEKKYDKRSLDDAYQSVKKENPNFNKDAIADRMTDRKDVRDAIERKAQNSGKSETEVMGDYLNKKERDDQAKAAIKKALLITAGVAGAYAVHKVINDPEIINKTNAAINKAVSAKNTAKEKVSNAVKSSTEYKLASAGVKEIGKLVKSGASTASAVQKKLSNDELIKSLKGIGTMAGTALTIKTLVSELDGIKDSDKDQIEKALLIAQKSSEIGANAGTIMKGPANQPVPKNDNKSGNNGNKNNTTMNKNENEKIREKVGNPKGGFDDKKWNQMFQKYQPTDEQKNMMRNMKKANYSTDQIEEYVFHDGFSSFPMTAFSATIVWY